LLSLFFFAIDLESKSITPSNGRTLMSDAVNASATIGNGVNVELHGARG